MIDAVSSASLNAAPMVSSRMGVSANEVNRAGADQAAAGDGSVSEARRATARPNLLVTAGDANRAAAAEQKTRPHVRRLDDALSPTAARETAVDLIARESGAVRIDA